MAWVTPTAVAAGDAILASKWNQDVKDNALAIRNAQINVVSASVTAVSTYSIASGGEADITGLTATITPSESTSKVLVLVHVAGSETTAVGGFGVRLKRGTTTILQGNADGSTIRLSARGRTDSDTSSEMLSFAFLDSPASTTAVTYKVTLAAIGGSTATYIVNRGSSVSTTSAYSRETSGITLIEVPA